MKAVKIGLLTIVIFIPVILIVIYFRYQTRHPETNDAYIQVDILQVSSIVTGRVQAIYVKDQQKIHQDDALFQIDPEPYQIALKAAKASLAQALQTLYSAEPGVLAAKAAIAQAQIQYELAQKNAARILPLVAEKDLPATQGDQAKATLESAKLGVEVAKNKWAQIQQQAGAMDESNPSILSAEAGVEQAEYQLNNARYRSPVAGEIANLNFSIGDLVGPGRVLFAIVPTNKDRIFANFKETQLPYLKVGSPVKISLLMYPGVVFHGVVHSIGEGSQSSFSLLPSQNATGNFVEVARRFRVVIDFINPDPRYPLRLGASCTVRVE